jgi:UDP-3-O-[3-hydroxymyristoyl] glucosamine N-acyltransferase
MRNYTAGELADILNGKLCYDSDIIINGLSSPENASEGKVVCLFDDYKPENCNVKASLFVASKKHSSTFKPSIEVISPKAAFVTLLEIFNPYKKEDNKNGISEHAFVSKTADVNKSASVHPGVHIGDECKIGKNTIIYQNTCIGKNVIIGDNTIIKANAVIESGCIIGNDVIIHSGAIIGSDGFGFFFDEGKHKKIPQIGAVIIEDEVEIGANTCIDRATIDYTIIRKGTKIDNLVQIGHNCDIGEKSIIVSQVGISGSSKLGKGCVVAGQVGISDHVTIDDNITILAKSGVNKSVFGKGRVLFGIPAKDALKMKKQLVYIEKLPELFKNKIRK